MIELTQVRVEYGDNPLGICASPHPAIDWAYAGGLQSAYRVEIKADEKTLWDSGWVSSAQTKIHYDGAALPLGTPCFGDVTIRDENGKESEKYPFLLTYGQLDAWPAQWLADPQPGEDRPALFIGEILLRRPVAYATAFFAATGYLDVEINQFLLENSRMNPAFSQFDKRCYYVMYPGLELRKGKNVIHATVAPGWRSPHGPVVARMENPPAFVGETAFSAAILVTYQDGSQEWFLSNPNWRCQSLPTVYSNIFMGETYDASFVPAAPVPARVTACPTEKMTLQTVPPVIPHTCYPPVTIWELEPDNYVVDFGQNIAGVCQLALPSHMEKGQTITIEHMEHLDEDGSLYLPNLRNAACKDTYIASGDERDLDAWSPRYTYHGFRYAQIKGYKEALLPEYIEAIALYTDVDSLSDFRCGSAHVNAIHSLVTYTERANIHSILTDCPQRDERMGWMNDATVRFEETPYNFKVGQLFPKVVRDLMDVQDEEGRITCTAPYAFGGRPADPVCSSFLVAGWQSYMHNGDDDILREAFDAYCRWDDYLESRSEDGIVQYSYYGDWAAPAYSCAAPENATSAVTPGILMSTGYHYYNNILLSQMAKAIGRDPSPYEARAGKIRAAFLTKWWNEETGVVATGSQACQAFALWLDILPESGREKAARVLRDDLVKCEYQFTTGNLCTRYMMDVLARYGYIDDAWKLLTREEYPSFGFMMQNEATTVWERFELKKNPGMNSHNHPMYGAVGYWFYAYLAGAKPAAPGWERAEIHPHYPTNLLSCQASVDTPKGILSVRWIKRYGNLHLYVQIPCGMTADVETPEGKKTVQGGFHHWTRPL